MTDEEKNKRSSEVSAVHTSNGDIVDTHSSGNTKTVSTTVETPSTTTTSTTLSPEGQSWLGSANEQSRLRYGVDENGRISRDEKDSEPLLGFNAAKYREDEEKKAKLERFKQKEAGWRNALSVVSDIVSASLGGNVWKRDKDSVAADAKKRQEEIETNLRGIQPAINKAADSKETALQNELYGNAKKAYDIFGQKNTIKTGGTKTQTSETEFGRNDPKVINARANWYSAKNSGSGKKEDLGKTIGVSVRIGNGQHKYDFDADTPKALEFARSAIYSMSQEYQRLAALPSRDALQDKRMNQISQIFTSAGIANPEEPVKNNGRTLSDKQCAQFLQGGDTFEFIKDDKVARDNLLELDKSGELAQYINETAYPEQIVEGTKKSNFVTSAQRAIAATNQQTMPGVSAQKKGASYAMPFIYQ